MDFEKDDDVGVDEDDLVFFAVEMGRVALSQENFGPADMPAPKHPSSHLGTENKPAWQAMTALLIVKVGRQK